MQDNIFPYKRILVLLLFLFSASVMWATIFYTYDKAGVIAVNACRSDLWDFIWLYITDSAAIISYGAVVVVLLLSFFTRNRTLKAKYYAVVLAGILAPVFSTGLKIAIHRTRPFYLFTEIHPLGPRAGYSFPSGHTSTAFFLAAILWMVFPKQRILIALTCTWALLVGISRLYLGVHYPSDVVAGMATGSAAALAALAVVKYCYKPWG